jgi:Flp pilus assembly protein TadG
MKRAEALGRGTAPRREQGTVILLIAVGLLALVAVAGLAVDLGNVWATRTQLQAASDASSLAAAGNLLQDQGTVVDTAAALAAAQSYGVAHQAGQVNVEIAPGDVAFGSWDVLTETFTPLPGETDPNLVRAARVVARRDAAQNSPLPMVLTRVVGVDTMDVSARSVAYIGFAASFPPGSLELPIAIDCCAISGDSPGAACTQNYCSTVQSSPPNPCPLASGEMATCLQFHSTPEQNACWTAFDPNSAAVSASKLRGIVEDGNSYAVSEPVYVDNGTKTPVISDIYERFIGEGRFSGNPSGTDTNGDGNIDSWVTVLPVVECQSPGGGCSSSSPQQIVGAVCFEIKEVLAQTDKIIKGNFLCPDDSRCQPSGLGPGGTLPGGLSAQAPVLVQ